MARAMARCAFATRWILLGSIPNVATRVSMSAPSACGDDGDSNGNGGTDGGGGDATLTLRLGHSYGIDSLQNRAAEQLAENVNEASDGRLTIEVFPASQLGSWEEMQEGLEIGSVDIVIESVGSLERYTDLAAIEGVPFLYRDADHFFAVWDGEIGDEIIQAIRDESGFPSYAFQRSLPII